MTLRSYLRPIRGIAWALLLPLAMHTAPSAAATLTVPADHSTIGAALLAATAGDTIRVDAGQYAPSSNGETFPLMVSGDVTLLGAGSSACELDAEGTGSVLLIDSGAPVVRGFRIVGGDADRGGGAQILGGSPELSDCLFAGNGALRRGSGINVQGTAAPWIHHNVIWESFDTNLTHAGDPHGVQLGESATGLIEHNLIGRGDSNGLLVGESAAPTIRHNIFYENGIPGVRGRGICNLGDPSAVISHNLFFGNQIAAIIMPNPGGGFIDLSGEAASALDTMDTVYGNLDGDPMLLNPGLELYQLTSASPAIDAGEVALGVDPDGTPLDLGPFYYSQVVSAPPLRERSVVLLPNVPNPFNPRTTIRFEVAAGGPVDVMIFDPRGRLVRALLSQRLDAGYHELLWDGVDTGGSSVASGVYWVRVRTRFEVAARSIALIR